MAEMECYQFKYTNMMDDVDYDFYIKQFKHIDLNNVKWD